MSLYVSTSRKPSQTTRKLARALALLLGGECENRGKKSVDECVERAESKGFGKILFIYEKHGNPSEIAFFDSEKGWLEPSVEIKNVEFSDKEKGKRLPEEAVAVPEDELGKKIAGLLDLREPEDEPVEMHLSEKEIKFVYCGKRVGPLIKLK